MSGRTLDDALGLLETTGWTPAMVALDRMEKTGGVRVLQAELNDLLGVCVKVVGPTANVSSALSVGRQIADELGGRPVIDLIHRVDPRAEKAICSQPEFNPLIQQDVVVWPHEDASLWPEQHEETTVAKSSSFALGLIETQGFTAVFEAIDTACKAANVEVVGKEKLGGGYVTVVIKGDVAAVNAAIQAGQQKVEGLGKMIAAHVIARPSPAVLCLLPQA